MEVSGWFPISGWEIRCCLLAVAENAWLPQHGKQGRIPKLRTLEVDLGEWSWSWWQEAGDNWGHTTVITHSPGVVQWNILELETGLPSQAHHQHQQFLLEFSSKAQYKYQPKNDWIDARARTEILLCGTIYLLLKPLDREAHHFIQSYTVIPTGHLWFWPSVASPTKTPDQGSKHWRASRPRAIVQPCAPFELRPRTKQQFVQQGTEATEAWASGTSGLSISWRTHCAPIFLS